MHNCVVLALDRPRDYTNMIYASAAADRCPTRHFDIMYVDEAQNLSPMRLSIILRLSCPTGRRRIQAQVLGRNIARKLVSRVVRFA